MELDTTYYQLIFTTGQDFFVASDIDDKDKFLKMVDGDGLLRSHYITLNLINTQVQPIDLRADKLVSVQKVNKGIIGTQTKVWRLE